MKIFGMDLGAGSQFTITEDDRLWVEENFRWLKMVFGYPNKMEEQVLLNTKFFPATFTSPVVRVENVIADLCQLFGISPESIKFEIHTDLRDFNNIPYEIEGKVFECETELKKGDHKIYVANSLLKQPDRLIYSLIYEFIRIRLTESELEYDAGGDDTELFIYLAGIYYGFGVILAQNLLDAGRSSDGMWEIKWNYVSQMPQPVMAFSLATYANLTGDNDPPWKNEFKSDFKKMFEDAVVYLAEHPNDLYDEREVKANDLFIEANKHFDNNNLEAAIDALQKILFLTTDESMKADVYNNMGYYYLRKQNYTQGISNFRKALTLCPDYGYANDNLGYSLIMAGELEEGKSYLEKALATENNDIAYTYRNFALYHQRRNEMTLAEDFFQKSFNEQTPVDLLEYHYAEFLFGRGHRENAKAFYLMSAAKKEEEGLKKVSELKLS